VRPPPPNPLPQGEGEDKTKTGRLAPFPQREWEAGW
jgi:hypothetical protein